MTAVKTGHVVDYQGKGTGRPIYEFVYDISADNRDADILFSGARQKRYRNYQ